MPRRRRQPPRIPGHHWPAQIFNDRPIQDGKEIVAIDAPYRAEDAALVPIEMRSLLPAGDTRRIVNITLVIDENPSPLAATFAPAASSGMTSLSTRIRVDAYTNLHAVAELDDGHLYGAQRFIKAAGGCSAPAAKQDAELDPARDNAVPTVPARGRCCSGQT